jgi:serine/threonine-protein kinase
LFSLPAAIGVLLIQLRHGASFMMPGEALPAAHYVDSVVQNQVILLGSCAVAVAASRVNLGLRRSRFDARSVGQYKIGRLLGRGAMGEVYLATHAMLKRPTAIKLLQPKITGEAALRRFEREVRQTSRLTHPNTVSIFDYGHTADGVFYYAMEYLEGATLAEIVEATGALPAERVIHVLVAACGALGEAHAKGLVHRDIKPANIMLCERGDEPDVVKLLDFGLVQDLSQQVIVEHKIMGTPETMAPEIILGREIGPPADLYALGAVGYYLATGQPVFEPLTVRQMLRAHQSRQPVAPSEIEASVPADLEELLLRCLRKDPGERPASALELRRELLACTDAGAWTHARAAAWWQTFEGPSAREHEDGARVGATGATIVASVDTAATIVAPRWPSGQPTPDSMVGDAGADVDPHR